MRTPSTTTPSAPKGDGEYDASSVMTYDLPSIATSRASCEKVTHRDAHTQPRGPVQNPSGGPERATSVPVRSEPQDDVLREHLRAAREHHEVAAAELLRGPRRVDGVSEDSETLGVEAEEALPLVAGERVGDAVVLPPRREQHFVARDARRPQRERAVVEGRTPRRRGREIEAARRARRAVPRHTQAAV